MKNDETSQLKILIFSIEITNHCLSAPFKYTQSFLFIPIHQYTLYHSRNDDHDDDDDDDAMQDDSIIIVQQHPLQQLTNIIFGSNGDLSPCPHHHGKFSSDHLQVIGS